MSDWVDDDETPDVKTWKEEARALQQIMFLRLGDREWDEWDESDIKILRYKVEFGLYPLSENLPERNTLTLYEEQSKNINLIADAILGNAESGRDIHFACIFVLGKIGDKQFYVPVFKVKGKHNQTLFIDSDCRVYKNWQDYLNSNHLPKCLYCYPRDGLYQGDKDQVLVDFGKSPACDLKNKTVVNFASTSVMMNSLSTPIPAATQLTSASTEALLLECTRATTRMRRCTTRSVEDEQLHVQSIDSDDLVARMDQLRIKGDSLKDAQNFLHENITQAAAAGEVVTIEQARAYNVLTLGSLTVNGLEILKNILLLIDKKEKGTLSDFDDLHFETSVLFFANNLLQAKTARKVIEDTQQEVLNRHCDDLTPSQIPELFKLCEFSQGETWLQRNANNIKAINRICDKQTFYESLVAIKADLEGYPVGFSPVEPGVININNELHIAPNKFVEISAADRKQILDATQKVKDSAGIVKDYWKEIEKILKKYRVVMERQRDEKIARLKKAFKTDNLDTIKIGSKEIFKNMTPSEVDRLTVVIQEAGKHYPKILEITNEFAKMRNCKNPRDYSNYVAFVTTYVSNFINPKVTEFREDLKDHVNRGIEAQTFMRAREIKGKYAVHFSNKFYDHFFANLEESLKALDERYIDLAEAVLPLNANIAPNFASDASAISHYFKHSDFHSMPLTAEQYFSIASELVNEPLNRRSAQLNQQGDRMMIIFTNPINGAKGIVFEKLGDGTRSLATVFFDENVLNQSN